MSPVRRRRPAHATDPSLNSPIPRSSLAYEHIRSAVHRLLREPRWPRLSRTGPHDEAAPAAAGPADLRHATDASVVLFRAGWLAFCGLGLADRPATPPGAAIWRLGRCSSATAAGKRPLGCEPEKYTLATALLGPGGAAPTSPDRRPPPHRLREMTIPPTGLQGEQSPAAPNDCRRIGAQQVAPPGPARARM